MNLLWLDDFLALASTGNFSRAAEARHMTQPAFSRRIRALEEWLGVALVDRTSHPVTLTEVGEWFRAVAQEILARVDRVPDEARAVADASSATLRIASTHALSLTFLPAWLRGLESRVAVGPVQLVSDVMQQCEAAMLRGRVQFVLCHAHAQLPNRLEQAGCPSVKVGADALLPVCAPDAGHALPAPGAPGDGRVAVLAYSPESGIGRLVRTLLGPALDAARAEPVFTAHLATVLKSMALEGRGIAWLPRSLIADELAAGRLVAAGAAAWAVDMDVRLYRQPGPAPATPEAFWRAVQ